MILRSRLGVAAAVVAAILVNVADGGSTASAAPQLRGTISYGSFRSEALRGTDHYAVYLPPGYAGSSSRYPVVYFLHGLPASADPHQRIGTIPQAVEQSGHRAIVVGVQGARSGDLDPEWLDHGRGRNWETATAVGLMHAIDSRYRTIPTRAGRLLVGISAGGYGATLIADHHPA